MVLRLASLPARRLRCCTRVPGYQPKRRPDLPILALGVPLVHAFLVQQEVNSEQSRRTWSHQLSSIMLLRARCQRAAANSPSYTCAYEIPEERSHRLWPIRRCVYTRSCRCVLANGLQNPPYAFEGLFCLYIEKLARSRSRNRWLRSAPYTSLRHPQLSSNGHLLNLYIPHKIVMSFIPGTTDQRGSSTLFAIRARRYPFERLCQASIWRAELHGRGP